MRQLNNLRGWCKDVFPRDAGNGLYDPDCADEDAPQPTPPPARGLTAVQRTPPGSLPGLRGGPSISPAPKADQRQASPSARRSRRERDRSRDRRDRSRDRGARRNRSREPVPRASDAASDAALARLSEPGALADEARIAQLDRQARLARAEAAALEAQRALDRQRAGGTHANRVLDLRADPQRSGMSDTASDASRSAVTPPGIGSARRSEVLGGLGGLSPRPPPAPGGSSPRPPAANADPPAVNPAADDDDDAPQIVSEDPLANKCVLCHDKPRTARILPCNHDAFCLECILQVFRGEAAGGERTCPLCRRDIHQVVQNGPPPAPPGPPAAGAPAPPAPPAAGAAPAVNI